MTGRAACPTGSGARRVTIRADGLPIRGPAAAGPSPSRLDRPSEPRQDPPGPALPHAARPISARRASPRAAAADQGGDGRDRGPALDGHPVGGQRGGRPDGRRRGQGPRQRRELHRQRRREPGARPSRPPSRTRRPSRPPTRRTRTTTSSTSRSTCRPPGSARTGTPSGCGSRSRTRNRSCSTRWQSARRPSLVIPEVELQKGRNDFQASINGPGGEGELSGVTTWVLDQSRPEDHDHLAQGELVHDPRLRHRQGQDAGRSVVRLKNDLSTAVVTVEAGKDGLFEAKVGVATGDQHDHDHGRRPGRQPQHRDHHGAQGLGRHAGVAHRHGVPVHREAAAQDRAVHGHRDRPGGPQAAQAPSRCSRSASRASRPSSPTRR